MSTADGIANLDPVWDSMKRQQRAWNWYTG